MHPTDLLRRHHDVESPGPELAVLPGLISGGTLLVAFTLMAVGFEYFWVTFILGFGVVLPTAIGILAATSHTETGSRRLRTDPAADPHTQTQTSRETDAALATLRHRYAQGDLSDAEFEHRVEQLLDTDSIDTSPASVSFDGD